MDWYGTAGSMLCRVAVSTSGGPDARAAGLSIMFEVKSREERDQEIACPNVSVGRWRRGSPPTHRSRHMAILDYSTEAELSPIVTDVELSLIRRRKMRQPTGFGRFARAADAIRFAIEELPPEVLLATQLKVAEERFNGEEIRRLYERIEYPLIRRAADGERTRQYK
jgi:hypothetical protein